ncbi:hypothetical protein F5X96DRAFT_681446 [Biscogniauxia mediterranea]|nr:hypothetical protein F5X96DRAFT_681446 [Biscogniauxia mediterranea]
MHSLALLTTGLLSTLATPLVAMPTLSSRNITSAIQTSRGVVDRKHGFGLDDVPPECLFQTKLSYWWVQLHLTYSSVCMGGPLYDLPGYSCTTSEWWPDPYVDSMIDAVTQQTTKDGQFEFSTSGHWTVGFAVGTTAIPDRDFTRAKFEEMVKFFVNDCDRSPVSCTRQQVWYWYKVDGQEMEIQYSMKWSLNCPSEEQQR